MVIMLSLYPCATLLRLDLGSDIRSGSIGSGSMGASQREAIGYQPYHSCRPRSVLIRNAEHYEVLVLAWGLTCTIRKTEDR